MHEALAFARIAYAEQEVPIGAVVVRDGKMIGRGRNRRERLADPTHHAEIEAIREAAQEVGNLAPRGRDPLRHPGALRHVRGRRRQRADRAHRLRLRGSQGRATAAPSATSRRTRG